MSMAKIFDCLEVTQNIGTFYVFVASAEEILPFLTVERRGLSEAEQEKVQRALDVKRQKEIAQYLLQDDATFPTTVTVNADSNYIHLVEDGHGHKLVFGTETDDGVAANVLTVTSGTLTHWFTTVPDGQKPAEIIDGQHRIEGMRLAMSNAQNPDALQTLKKFDIPLAVMFDLTPEDAARVFVTINSTQRKVDSSHIADLFALTKSRSPKRTCHLIARAVDRMEGGPFQNGLKMLGKRVDKTEFLSQGSFVKYLLKLISKNPEADERAIQMGEAPKADSSLPLRGLFISKQDSAILAVVHNFFAGVRRVYPVAWEELPAEYLLRKTVGFSAMIGLLKQIATAALASPHTQSEAAFTRVMERVKTQVPEEEWKVGKFSSSEAAAGKMTKRMADAVLPDLVNLLQGA